MLQPNTPAPKFKLIGDDGDTYTLHGYRDSWVVIYFYPKDDTPGCTTEACMIKEVYDEFTKRGVTVFGISKDSPESHLKFKTKYSLPFTLLSDPDMETIQDYEAQNALGGTMRITYIVDPVGVITKSYAKVDPAHHAQQLLDDLKNIINA